MATPAIDFSKYETAPQAPPQIDFSKYEASATSEDDTGIWAGVKRNTVGLVNGLYHALSDPATDEEKQELLKKVKDTNAKGDKVPEDLATNPSQATLAYHRLIDAPADQLYKKSGDELSAAKDLLSKGDTWKGAGTYASGIADRGLASIPMFGPWVNGVAERAEKGDVSGAATDVASAVLMSKGSAAAKATGEGLGKVKAGMDSTMMQPSGDLTKTGKTISQVAGGITGSLPGLTHGNIPVAMAGGAAGYKMGPVLAEHIFNPPATYPGASLPLAEEFYQAKAADLMRREAAQRVLDLRSSAAAKAAARNAPVPTDTPVQQNPGASLPSIDDFYQSRGQDILRREAQQRMLDVRAAAAAKEAARNVPAAPQPSPFGNATPTNVVHGNAPVPAVPLSTLSGPAPQLVKEFAKPEPSRIVDPNSPPPPNRVTYQSVPRADLLTKVMKGDRLAIQEWIRRGLPLPKNAGLMVESGAQTTQ